MAKMDQLLRDAGDRMAESVGAGRGPAAAPAGEACPAAGPYEGRTKAQGVAVLALERLATDPDQPRRHFDAAELERLAASLRDRGLLAPIRVRWRPDLDRWVILCGERRYRAALTAGLTALPCLLVERDLTPEEVLLEQLAENLLRVDLGPLEEARGYRRLLDLRGWKAKELAGRVGVDPARVTRVLALLDLPEDVQGRVAAGELTKSAAYEISRLEGADEQREAARRVVEHRLRREDVAEEVKARKTAGRSGRRPPAPLTLTARHASGLRLTAVAPARKGGETLLAAFDELAARLREDLRGRVGKGRAA